MKIATYNVNSIRQRLPILLDWMAEHRPDVMCLQETKVQDHEFPVEAIRQAGYHSSYRGMKAYNGVATLSRVVPENVVYGLHEGADNDDYRIIRTVIDGIPIVNSYIPQGYKVDSDKYAIKLAWFRRLKTYFETCLRPDAPAIWLGDLNIAPEPIDVYHPDKRVNDPDFHIDARLAYKDTVSWGFVDVFRQLHPDAVQYTYWDFFRNAFERNFGWRIDHILATPPMAARCRTAEIDTAPRAVKGASDHTIMWAEFD